MSFSQSEIKSLNEPGVYKITCVPSNKHYVGSTIRRIHQRFSEHLYELEKGIHKNPYMQNSWNKYGADSFKFDILEVTPFVEERETFWMKELDCCNPEKGFNINPNATGFWNRTPEQIKSKSEKAQATLKLSFEYSKKVKSGEISIEEVPKKHLRGVNHFLNKKTWNKGLTKEMGVDYSFLKGLKRNYTDKWKTHMENNRQRIRATAENILVYDPQLNFLGEFECAMDIERLSIENPNHFPVILRNKEGRNGYPPTVLKSYNVGAVCLKKKKHYKGLIFRFKSDTSELLPLSEIELTSRGRFKRQLLNDNSVNSGNGEIPNPEPSITNENKSSDEGATHS